MTTALILVGIVVIAGIITASIGLLQDRQSPSPSPNRGTGEGPRRISRHRIHDSPANHRQSHLRREDLFRRHLHDVGREHHQVGELSCFE